MILKAAHTSLNVKLSVLLTKNVGILNLHIHEIDFTSRISVCKKCLLWFLTSPVFKYLRASTKHKKNYFKLFRNSFFWCFLIITVDFSYNFDTFIRHSKNTSQLATFKRLDWWIVLCVATKCALLNILWRLNCEMYNYQKKYEIWQQCMIKSVKRIGTNNLDERKSCWSITKLQKCVCSIYNYDDTNIDFHLLK